MQIPAFVSFPNAPLTETLIRNALAKIPSIEIVEEIPSNFDRLLQFCTYDGMNHELTLSEPDSVLSSCYTIRKSLIRKHFLNRIVSVYTSKHPESLLCTSVPKTWDFDIAWADELDDLLADELWELSHILDSTVDNKWFILKPGMADGGNGIRLFKSKDQLQEIFEEFDNDSESEDVGDSENVMTSQLRHFVIQKYLENPLLLDPREIGTDPKATLKPFKFHLRTYCVASGGLKVYMWKHILALFAGIPYTSLDNSDDPVDLKAHLTNTVLIQENAESSVLLLSELANQIILSSSDLSTRLTVSDIETIVDQAAEVIGEAFRAALASPIHFQVLPNAFELFGIDLLVTYTSGATQPFRVFLMEINAEPAIEKTGLRLQWILQDMFHSITDLIIRPFAGVDCDGSSWEVGEIRAGFRKCLDERVRS